MDQPRRGPPKFGALKTKGSVIPPDLKKPSAHELALAPTVAAPAPFKSAAMAAAETGALPKVEEAAGTLPEAKEEEEAAAATAAAAGEAAPITLRIRRKKPVIVGEAAAEAASVPIGEAVSESEGVGSVAKSARPTGQQTTALRPSAAPIGEGAGEPKLTIRRRAHPAHAAFKAQKTEEETKDVYLIKSPPPAFVPPTRRGFITFFENTFNETGEAAADFMLPPKKLGQKDLDACKKLGKASAVEAFKYQQFIREYLRGATPYRGLLVYHGLGSGKTCSAIAAAEALYGISGKKIIIMTPGSLRPNFQAQISFCGYLNHASS